MGEMISMAEEMISMFDSSGTDSDFSVEPEGEHQGSGIFEESRSLFSDLPDSVMKQLPYPELVDQAVLSIKMDTIKEEGWMKMILTYENYEQYKKLIENVVASQGKDESGMTAMMEPEDIEDMFADYEMDLEKGIIKLEGWTMESLMEDPDFSDLAQYRDSLDQMSEEDLEMIKMLFGGPTKTIIHLPGKIKSCTDPTAKVDGQMITFEDDLFNVMAGKQELHEREIKFKKVKTKKK